MYLRRLALLTLALAAAAVLQTALGQNLTIRIVRPDLVLLVVVTNSAIRGMEEGLLGGLLGGLMVEVFSAAPFGGSILAMGVIGLATGLWEANVYRTSVLIPVVAVFLATILYHSFLLLAFQGAGWTVEWISTLALQTVPGAVENACLSPLVFLFVRRMVPSSNPRAASDGRQHPRRDRPAPGAGE